jgi:hypothetical protein
VARQLPCGAKEEDLPEPAGDNFEASKVPARAASEDESAAFRAFERTVSCDAFFQPKKLLSAGHPKQTFCRRPRGGGTA